MIIQLSEGYQEIVRNLNKRSSVCSSYILRILQKYIFYYFKDSGGQNGVYRFWRHWVPLVILPTRHTGHTLYTACTPTMRAKKKWGYIRAIKNIIRKVGGGHAMCCCNWGSAVEEIDISDIFNLHSFSFLGAGKISESHWY